jgi:hypothetical protein
MSKHTTGIPVTAARSTPATPRSQPTPRTGDVLASGRTARADIHEISVVPAEPDAVATRYSEAMRKVRERARRLGVDGWYTSDSTHYVRVATYRAREDADSLA